MDATKRTILCVDDEKDILDSLFDTFMDIYDVKTAGSGAEALQIFGKENVALVISDQRMPQMEGAALLEKITELKPQCKKILLTGYADINAAVEAINKGAVDKYFSKPWDDAELTKTVEALIRKYDHEMSLAKMLEQDRDMKEVVIKAKSRLDLLGLFEKFFRSYLCGVCLVSDESKIIFINSAGLEMMKYSDPAQVLGKDFDLVFSLTNQIKSFFLDKYTTREQVSHTWPVKTGDGSFTSMQATIIFIGEADDAKVAGIVLK
jgi:response regulator RpfG family c-di-GMP phosphodiesterase